MDSPSGRRSRKDSSLREASRELLCAAFSKRGASGRHDELVRKIPDAVSIPKEVRRKQICNATTDSQKGMTTMTSTTTAAPTQTSTTTWNIDPAHSIAEFKLKHMMIANVKGQFSKVSGALFLDESDLENSRWRRGHHHSRCRVREGLTERPSTTELLQVENRKRHSTPRGDNHLSFRCSVASLWWFLP